MKKKVGIIIIAALVFLLILVGVFLLFFNKAKKPKEPTSYDTYVIEQDSVPSVTSVLEEERKLLSFEKIEDETTNTIEQKYVYGELETGNYDIKTYVDELIKNQGLVAMIDFNTDYPAGYVSIAKDSFLNENIFQVDIFYTQEGYTISVKRLEGSLPKPKEPEPKKKESSTLNRETAVEFLEEFEPSKLGIPSKASNYMVIINPGQANINGKACYGINLYEENSYGSNNIMGTYYVALDKSAVFKYNVSNDTYTSLELPVDKTTAQKLGLWASGKKTKPARGELLITKEGINENIKGAETKLLKDSEIKKTSNTRVKDYDAEIEALLLRTIEGGETKKVKKSVIKKLTNEVEKTGGTSITGGKTKQIDKTLINADNLIKKDGTTVNENTPSNIENVPEGWKGQ